MGPKWFDNLKRYSLLRTEDGKRRKISIWRDHCLQTREGEEIPTGGKNHTCLRHSPLMLSVGDKKCKGRKRKNERKKERKKSSRVKAVNNGWSKKVSSLLQAARDSRIFAQGVYFHGEFKSIEITHLLLRFLLYMRNNHYGPKCAKKLWKLLHRIYFFDCSAR